MNGRARGFTLLEVLIALAIVALSVGALLGTVTSSASNVIYLKEKTLAEWVALNRLTEIRIAQQMPDKGKRTGSAEMGGLKWQWEEEVTELPIKGMFRVDVHARPTGEAAKEIKSDVQSSAQTETASSASGSELEKVNWTATVFGVMGTAQSARRDAIASPLIGSLLNNSPNNQGGQNGAPGSPGAPVTPGTPGAPGNPGVKPPARDR
jgi:general secretion pathway protein I